MFLSGAHLRSGLLAIILSYLVSYYSYEMMIDPSLCNSTASQSYVQTVMPLVDSLCPNHSHSPSPFFLTLQMLSKQGGNFEGGCIEYRDPSQSFYCQEKEKKDVKK